LFKINEEFLSIYISILLGRSILISFLYVLTESHLNSFILTGAVFQSLVQASITSVDHFSVANIA